MTSGDGGGDRPGFRRERPLWPAEIARDVEEEIAAHVAERRDEYATRGLPPDEAAAAAIRRFGNRDAVAAACARIDRDVRIRQGRTRMLGDLRHDVVYAFRLFRHNPGFAAVAIATLAIGIGATTTIFTLANWALFRPVPGVADPANVSVFWVGRRSSDRSFSPHRLSYPNLADVSARLTSMSIGAYQGGGSGVATAGGGQAARNVAAEYVTASYFEVLGVRMQIGRPFTAADDTPPAPRLVAVISDRLWQSMFHRDPDVLQQPLDIAGVRFGIAGVAPPGFHGTERLSMTDMWLPGAATPIVRHTKSRYDARDSGGYYELVARLRPGATWAQAEAELESLRAWLRAEYPKDNEHFRTTGFHLMGPIGPPPFARDLMKKVVGLTAGAASGLVLLIACANVAGLLMIRGVSRRGEIGIRKALGAGRWRLVRQQITEGLMLWILGGVAALLFVSLLNSTVEMGSLVGMRGIDVAPAVDWRVLAFSAAVSLAVGVLFSIAPAIRATRAEAAETLRTAAPTVTHRTFVGTSLAVFQLAASLTLLVGAFLLAGTLSHLSRVPLGFDADDVFLFTVRPSIVGYTDAAALEYLDEFQRRLGGVAGVRQVAAANGAPFFGGANMTWKIRPSDAPGAAPLETVSNVLFSPSYFETLGVPLIKGRMFTGAEFAAARRGESRVVIINQDLARRLFGAADPLGRGIEFPNQGRMGDQRYDVIGIVGSARYRSLVTAPEERVYEPAGPQSVGIAMGATLIVRTSGSVALAEQARGIAAALNPAMPLTGVISMAEAVGRARSEWDSLATIISVLAALAAVLACVGLYGVVAHAVAQRRREFGIRLALGASAAQLWRHVLRRAAVITGAGLLFGLAGGYAFAQVLSTRLVGVDPLDPVLWSLAAVSLVVVAVAASCVPARAATRVDVTETLRAL